MSSKRKWLVVALASVAVLSVTGIAFARGGGGHCRFGKDPAKVQKFTTYMVNDLLDDLNATDAQRAKALAIKDQLLKDAAPLMERREEMHDVLRQQLTGSSVDRIKVHALIDQRADEMRALAHKAADAAAELHAILTPEQRAQLLEKMEEHHGRWR